MFAKLMFHYDRTGKKRDEPLELDVKSVRGRYFYLQSSTYRCLGSPNLPAVHICRSYANLKTDPYNEDGRPPTVWTTIVYPHVTFYGGCVELFGFEAPNMVWAGHPTQAYRGCKPLSVPTELLWPTGPDGWRREPAPHELSELPRQLVCLVERERE